MVKTIYMADLCSRQKKKTQALGLKKNLPNSNYN